MSICTVTIEAVHVLTTAMDVVTYRRSYTITIFPCITLRTYKVGTTVVITQVIRYVDLTLRGVLTAFTFTLVPESTSCLPHVPTNGT